jgi:hypothetical protein
MSDKRLLNRSICADLVNLEWREKSLWGEEKKCECTAVLEDISAGGACLQVERPIPVELEAIIRHGERWSAHCWVKYCEFREIGYFVGIEFSDADAWSRFTFRPKHMLDLRALVWDAE